MGSWDPPDFLDGTFIWDRNGYFLADPVPTKLRSSGDVSSGDPWVEIAVALEQAKRGSHEQISGLRELISSESHPLLIRGCVALLADAGSKKDVEYLANLLHHDTSFIRLESAWAIRTAGHVAYTPNVLEAWHQADRPAERDAYALCLSCMLDSDSGPISSSDELTSSEYSDLVLKRFHEVVDRASKKSIQAWQGRTWELHDLLRYMIELASDSSQNPEDLRVHFVGLRHRFEAATGWDCRGFYHQRVFQPESVVEEMESFIATVDIDQFEVATRYFFGHEVPNQ